MSGITPTGIIPPTEPGSMMVGGLLLNATVLIFGLIIMALLGAYLILMIFGQPINAARATNYKGAMIQHVDTPKSATIKTANITGGALRYSNIADGTVAATSDSVFKINNKRMVFTFSNFGITIPLPSLTGVSIIVLQGIKNLKGLKEKYGENLDTVLVEGYDFENFNTLLEQTKTRKLIPLTVEAVPEFSDKNIDSNITETKISDYKQIDQGDMLGHAPIWDVMAVGIVIALLFIIAGSI